MSYIGLMLHKGEECYTFISGAVKIHIVKDSVGSLGDAATSAKEYFFGQ